MGVIKMGRKLTPKEKENKEINKAIKRIKTIEKAYGKSITRSSCTRYATHEREQAKLEREIREREEELQSMKKKAKN